MSAFTTKAKSNDVQDYELPPGGTYPAKLVAVIDLGTQTWLYQGQAQSARKVYLAWQLLDEAKEDGSPLIVGRDFTHSLHKKANLRAFLESWSGRTLQENEEIDLLDLLETTCNLSISEGLTATGKNYVEVASASKIMRGQVIPSATMQLKCSWHLTDAVNADSDPPIPEWLPRIYGRTVIDEIKASAEWKALATRKTQDNGAVHAPKASDMKDIPF
jgi:hypothetical protein